MCCTHMCQTEFADYKHILLAWNKNGTVKSVEEEIMAFIKFHISGSFILTNTAFSTERHA